LSSDPLLPDLPDVPKDDPARQTGEPEGSPERTDEDVEHPTGEKQAQENKDREPPA
jgi:hypothetical protein